jgi:hypothetical protein
MLIQRDDSPGQSPSKLSKQRMIAIPLTDGTTFSSRGELPERSCWAIPNASDFSWLMEVSLLSCRANFGFASLDEIPKARSRAIVCVK